MNNGVRFNAENYIEQSRLLIRDLGERITPSPETETDRILGGEARSFIHVELIQVGHVLGLISSLATASEVSIDVPHEERELYESSFARRLNIMQRYQRKVNSDTTRVTELGELTVDDRNEVLAELSEQFRTWNGHMANKQGKVAASNMRERHPLAMQHPSLVEKLELDFPEVPAGFRMYAVLRTAKDPEAALTKMLKDKDAILVAHPKFMTEGYALQIAQINPGNPVGEATKIVKEAERLVTTYRKSGITGKIAMYYAARNKKDPETAIKKLTEIVDGLSPKFPTMNKDQIANILLHTSTNNDPETAIKNCVINADKLKTQFPGLANAMCRNIAVYWPEDRYEVAERVDTIARKVCTAYEELTYSEAALIAYTHKDSVDAALDDAKEVVESLRLIGEQYGNSLTFSSIRRIATQFKGSDHALNVAKNKLDTIEELKKMFPKLSQNMIENCVLTRTKAQAVALLTERNNSPG